MSEEKCIYILDDDSAVRDALSVLVRSVGLNAQEFSSAGQFLSEFDPEIPGCLITDVYMPEMDGVALQEHLIQLGSQIPIIVMSGHGDIPLAVKMVRKGALDFIEKPFSNHLMLERIQQALALDAVQRSKSINNNRLQQRYATLTPREKEVFEYLISGIANKVIAMKMSVSPRTIETHRANIMHKMNSKSVVSLLQQMTQIRRTCK